MIALVIPCWNYRPETQAAVESILRNSAPHEVRFVFIDNGSTDDTLAYLKSVPSTAAVIHYDTNRLVTPAWNEGLEHALKLNPEIIGLLNNDILAGPYWLDPVVRELRARDKHYFHPNGEFIDPNTFEANARAKYPSLIGQMTTGTCGWALFFKPDAARLFHPIPDVLRLWHGDNWIHYVLGTKNGYTRRVLLDCFMHHRTSLSFGNLGHRGYDVTAIVQKDTAEFERLIGQTVTEWCATRPNP